MKKFIFALMTTAASTAWADEPIDIFPYTVGFPFPAATLERNNGTLQLQGGFLKLAAVSFDTPGCVTSTPEFISTGEGKLAVTIKLKRTYIGPIRRGQSLEGTPFANVEFHRIGEDGRARYSGAPMTFAILQRAMNERLVSQVDGLRFVIATDDEVQTYSALFEPVETFTAGRVKLCNVFQGSGFEIQSIKLYVMQ